jgi:hypothetical protein
LPDEKELDVVTVDLKSFDEANPQVTSTPSIQSPASATAASGSQHQQQQAPMSETFAAARAQFATIRFAEMIAETRAILHSPSFQVALNASFDAAFDIMQKQLRVCCISDDCDD